MARGQWAVVLGQVQRLFQGASVSGLSEGQLLDRFATNRDEDAFGAILARHGPMVLGVCRGVLADPADVDDAFQATFLVLVRKAATVRDGDRLAPWLYGVARRVALRARSDSARRRVRERRDLGEPVDPRSALDADRRELQALIREEVDRLPGVDRMAVLLCDLEGLTHEEAADRLGWPLGTVKGRLWRARERLRGRLTRRGVTLPGVAVAVASMLGEGAWASASVPPDLIRSTTLAATKLAAGQTLAAGIVSARVITLMEGAIATMSATKLKIIAATLVATVGVGIPAVLAVQGPGPGPVEKLGKAQVPSPKRVPAAGPVEGLAVADEPRPQPDSIRLEEARIADEALRLWREAVQNGKVDPPPLDRYYTWSGRLAQAASGPDAPLADRKTALLSHRDRMRTHLSLVTELVKSDRYTKFDLLEARFHVAEAERWLRDGSIERVDASRQAGSPGGMAMMGMGGMGVGWAGRQGGLAGVEAKKMMGPPMARHTGLAQSPADKERDQAISAMLDKPLGMNFPNPTPLKDVLKFLRDATQDEAAGFPNGLPFYVAPEGLEMAEETMDSTVTIQLEGVPLRTTLRLLLRQLDLDYRVDGGVILISDEGTITMQEMNAQRQTGLLKP